MNESPSKEAVDAALKSLDDSPRSVARQAIKKHRALAPRKSGWINVRTDSGAPTLRVDDVLRNSEPNGLIGKR